MNHEEQLLRSAYEAFNARDIDRVLAMMHPDVDWPNGMEGGRVLGQGAVREYWSRQWEILDPHVEPIAVRQVAPGETLVEVHQVVHDREGKLLVDQTVEHVYRIENGLIRSMQIRSS
jgi:hypothetical protein